MTSFANFKQAFRPSPVYLLALSTFVGHQFIQKILGWSIPFVDSYLDPFLSIPLLLGLAAAERNWLFGEAHWAGFKGVEIIAMTVALAVLFEEGFPWLDPVGQTRDIYDYVAYAFGAVAYYFFREK
ncbi:MAG: hypothetical protein AB8F78_08690 [Saprospiraceae bacterium]